jgi:hypothetical protein
MISREAVAASALRKSKKIYRLVWPWLTPGWIFVVRAHALARSLEDQCPQDDDGP